MRQHRGDLRRHGTSYSSDANGNVRTVTTITNDAMGRTTAVQDALGNRNTTTRDAAGMARTALFLRRTQNALAHHRRRAKEAFARLDYGLEDLRELVAAAVGRPCPYCRALVTDETFTCDHQDATSRGGSFGLANVRVCCKRCNETKGKLSDEELAALLGLIREWHPAARGDVLRRLRAGGRVRGRA